MPGSSPLLVNAFQPPEVPSRYVIVPLKRMLTGVVSNRTTSSAEIVKLLTCVPSAKDAQNHHASGNSRSGFDGMGS